jgi:hypothetical protein
VRSPASDFGGPILLYRSARWRTCSSRLGRSTSSHLSPRSSEARDRRQQDRPPAALYAARKRLISCGVGMSTPTFSLPFCRRSARRSPPRFRPARSSRTTFRLTSPRSCASAIMEPRLVRIFRTIAGERAAPSAAPGAGLPLSSASSKSRTSGTFSCESFTRPRNGRMCRWMCCRYWVSVVRSRPWLSQVVSQSCAASATVMLRPSWVCVPRLIDFDAGLICVSLPLPLKGLDVPLAVLVDVIDYPCLPLDACFFPSAFAN